MYLWHLLQNSGSTSNGLKTDKSSESQNNNNIFYQRGEFPCVVGHVDGTYSRIQAPCGNKNRYVNRKGFHSINVQGIM